jgi:hypothetical protein
LYRSTPLANAGSPAGTSKRIVYVALSRGWSLDGRKLCVPSGWPAVAEPSGVMKNGAPSRSLGSGTTGCAV